MKIFENLQFLLIFAKSSISFLSQKQFFLIGFVLFLELVKFVFLKLSYLFLFFSKLNFKVCNLSIFLFKLLLRINQRFHSILDLKKFLFILLELWILFFSLNKSLCFSCCNLSQSFTFKKKSFTILRAIRFIPTKFGCLGSI